jgi:hypothetical protein
MFKRVSDGVVSVVFRLDIPDRFTSLSHVLLLSYRCLLDVPALRRVFGGQADVGRIGSEQARPPGRGHARWMLILGASMHP